MERSTAYVISKKGAKRAAKAMMKGPAKIVQHLRSKSSFKHKGCPETQPPLESSQSSSRQSEDHDSHPTLPTLIDPPMTPSSDYVTVSAFLQGDQQEQSPVISIKSQDSLVSPQDSGVKHHADCSNYGVLEKVNVSSSQSHRDNESKLDISDSSIREVGAEFNMYINDSAYTSSEHMMDGCTSQLQSLQDSSLEHDFGSPCSFSQESPSYQDKSQKLGRLVEIVKGNREGLEDKVLDMLKPEDVLDHDGRLESRSHLQVQAEYPSSTFETRTSRNGTILRNDSSFQGSTSVHTQPTSEFDTEIEHYDEDSNIDPSLIEEDRRNEFQKGKGVDNAKYTPMQIQQTKHLDTAAKCTWRGCSNVSPNRDELGRHIENAHPGYLVCRDPKHKYPVYFQFRNQQKRHWKDVHKGEGRCACPYCGRSFSRKDGLRRHWKKETCTGRSKSEHVEVQDHVSRKMASN